MKNLTIIALIIFSSQAYAAGWEGQLVKISKNTLLCSYSYMEKALILQKAGDTDSIQAFINKGSCSKAPSDFYATVVKDASDFTDPKLAEVMVKGESIWGAMEDMDCCYNYK